MRGTSETNNFWSDNLLDISFVVLNSHQMGKNNPLFHILNSSKVEGQFAVKRQSSTYSYVRVGTETAHGFWIT